MANWNALSVEAQNILTDVFGNTEEAKSSIRQATADAVNFGVQGLEVTGENAAGATDALVSVAQAGQDSIHSMGDAIGKIGQGSADIIDGIADLIGNFSAQITVEPDIDWGSFARGLAQAVLDATMGNFTDPRLNFVITGNSNGGTTDALSKIRNGASTISTAA